MAVVPTAPCPLIYDPGKFLREVVDNQLGVLLEEIRELTADGESKGNRNIVQCPSC